MAAPTASTNAAVRASVVALATAAVGPDSSFAGAVHDSRSTPIDEDHVHPATNVILDRDRETMVSAGAVDRERQATIRVQCYAERDDGDEAALADDLDAMTEALRNGIWGDDAWRSWFKSFSTSSSRQLIDTSSRRIRGMSELTIEAVWEIETAQTEAPADIFDVASVTDDAHDVSATIADLYTE